MVFNEKDVEAMTSDDGFAEASFEKDAAEDHELRETVKSAVAGATSHADDDADFEEARPHLEELLHRNPGRKAIEAVSDCLRATQPAHTTRT